MTKASAGRISPFVGETEQNLARLFREADPRHTVLLLDEVDSFLADRRQARQQWERTQVNELLQQMERYPGIFIAATNRMSGLDTAAMRRFDFKLHFRALNPAQRRRLVMHHYRLITVCETWIWLTEACMLARRLTT